MIKRILHLYMNIHIEQSKQTQNTVQIKQNDKINTKYLTRQREGEIKQDISNNQGDVTELCTILGIELGIPSFRMNIENSNII